MPVSNSGVPFALTAYSVPRTALNCDNVTTSLNATTLTSNTTSVNNNDLFGNVRFAARYTTATESLRFGTMSMRFMKVGTPSGFPIYYRIRKQSDDSIVFEKLLYADASSISSVLTTYSVEFPEVTLPAGAYYFNCEFNGGDAGNLLQWWSANSVTDAAVPGFTWAPSTYTAIVKTPYFVLTKGVKWTFA